MHPYNREQDKIYCEKVGGRGRIGNWVKDRGSLFVWD